jgi:hypothetical protein
MLLGRRRILLPQTPSLIPSFVRSDSDLEAAARGSRTTELVQHCDRDLEARVMQRSTQVGLCACDGRKNRGAG